MAFRYADGLDTVHAGSQKDNPYSLLFRRDNVTNQQFSFNLLYLFYVCPNLISKQVLHNEITISYNVTNFIQFDVQLMRNHMLIRVLIIKYVKTFHN